MRTEANASVPLTMEPPKIFPVEILEGEMQEKPLKLMKEHNIVLEEEDPPTPDQYPVIDGPWSASEPISTTFKAEL